MKLILTLILFFSCFTSLNAGPGSSAGTGSTSRISSATAGFSFSAPYPTKSTFTDSGHEYEFGHHGMAVSLEEVEYNPEVCRRTNKHRTVCILKNEGNRITAIAVFADTTYKVVYSHYLHTGPALKARFDEFIGKFTQVQRNN